MPIHRNKARPPSLHLNLELPISSPQSDALLVVNPDGTIRAVNHTALDLLDCAAAEVLDQPVGRFFAERKKERKKDWAGSGAAGEVEATLVTRAGEHVRVVLIGSELLDAQGRSLSIVHVVPQMSPVHPLTPEAEANTLRVVAEALNRAAGLEEALDRALEAVTPLVGAEAGWITLLEEVAGVRLAAARNLPPALEADDRAAMQGPCQCLDLLRQGQLQAAVNVLECERLRTASGDTHGLRHHASVPIRAGGRALGNLNLTTPPDRVFSETELNLLTAVADQIAVAVERARLYEAERQRAQELASLNAVITAVGETLDLHKVLATALQQIVALAAVDGAECHLADDAGVLRLAAHHGLAPDFIAGSQGVEFHASEGIPGRAFASRAPVYAPDAATNGRYLRQDLARAAGYRSLLCVPILGRAALLGTFMLYTRKTREFTSDEQALLMSVGGQLALAIERARLHEQVKAHHIEEQAALLRLSQALLGATDAQAVMDIAVRLAAEALKVEFAAIALMDAGGKSFSGRAGVGWPPEVFRQAQRIPLTVDTGLAYAIRTRAPVVIPDEARETRFGAPPWVAQMGIAASLLVPMLVGGEPMGGLVINGRTPRAWSDDEVRLLALIANDTAQALERSRLYAQAQERLERISALHDIDVAIVSSLSLDERLNVLLEKVTERLHVDAAAVALVNSETGELRYAARRGLDEEFFKDGLLRVQEGIAGQVAHSGEAAAIPDVRAEPRFVRRAMAEQLGLISYLAVPLRARGEVIGVLELAARARHDFLPEEVDFFVTLAGQAAIAIDNVRMFEAARRRAAQQHALAEQAGAILAALDMPALWPAVMGATRQTLAADRAAVYLYDPAADRVTCPYASGLSSEYVAEINRRFHEAPGSRLLSDPRPVTIADAQTDPATAALRDWVAREGFRSYAVFPLTAPGAPLGALVAYRDAVAPFTADDIAAGQTLAHVVSVALQNARLFAATRRQLEELTVLHGVAVAGAEAAGEDTLIERATQIIGETLYPDNFGVLLLDEVAGVLRLHPSYRGVREEDKGLTIALGQGITGQVAATGQPRRVADVTREPDYLEVHGAMRSELCVPLKAGERVIGVINAESDKPDAFSEGDERLLFTLAGQLATAIEKVRLFDETRRRAAELDALAQVSSTLRQAQTREAMLPLLVETTMRLLDADSGALLLLETQPAASHLTFAAARGPAEALVGVQHPLGDDPLWRVVHAGEPMFIPDVTEENEFTRWEVCRALMTGMTACACVPLKTSEATVGLLHLAWQSQRAATEGEIRLLTSIAEMAGNALHRAALHEQTGRRAAHLAALHAIDLAISASLDLRMTLNVLLDQVTTQLRLDAADVLLLDPHSQLLEYAAGRGFRSRTVEQTRWRLGQGHAGRAALERKMVHVPDLRERKTDFLRSPLFAAEAFVAYYALPLVAKGQVKGVLEILQRSPLEPDPEWLQFLEGLATQAAIAVDNAALFDNLQRSNTELALAYDATIEGWSKALDLRDRETEGHTRRVTEMTLRLARAMGLSEEQIVHLRRGALLHDIGKMGVPDSILLKPGPLTDDDWQVMRLHPQLACDMLSPIAFLRPALDIPYCHHEKWDGTGYPRGLKDEGIPLAARIFAVVDVWDALRSDRPYRKARPEEQVHNYLSEQTSKHFDPQVVDVFLKLINRE